MVRLVGKRVQSVLREIERWLDERSAAAPSPFGSAASWPEHRRQRRPPPSTPNVRRRAQITWWRPSFLVIIGADERRRGELAGAIRSRAFYSGESWDPIEWGVRIPVSSSELVNMTIVVDVNGPEDESRIRRLLATLRESTMTNEGTDLVAEPYVMAITDDPSPLDIFRLLMSGVDASCVRPTSPLWLPEALHRARLGIPHVPPETARLLLEEVRKPPQVATMREAEILEWAADGPSMKQVMERHSVSFRSYERHLRHLTTKLSQRWRGIPGWWDEPGSSRTIEWLVQNWEPGMFRARPRAS